MDIVEIADVEESIARFGDRYLHRVFTEPEISACQDGRDARCLATCFAAKEAALKTLDMDGEAVDLRSIEIVLARDRWPDVRLTTSSARLAARENITRFAVTTSVTGDYAAAIVLAESAREPRERNGTTP
jgi:holo-[acyl-carrier protein] synthase